MVGVLTLLVTGYGQAADPKTRRVSQKRNGTEGNGASYVYRGGISENGRFVAFESYASNFIPNDDNGTYDVFFYDRTTRKLKLANVRSNGTKGDGSAEYPVISADGRIVAFESLSTNLVPDDTLDHRDIFVHNRVTGKTRRVSVRSNGDEANEGSGQVAISGTGRYVAFESAADNLVPNDDNEETDVFVHDRRTGRTTRVSVRSNGNEANSESNEPTISDNGRFVVFDSTAGNLVGNDGPGTSDVFIHDRETGKTKLVSVKSNGNPANGNSFYGVSSNNGRFIAFESEATNLVAGDSSSRDVFVHNRKTGKTRRVSGRPNGNEGDGSSERPDISPSGRFVVFDSEAEDLVPGDGNNFEDIFVHDRRTGNTRLLSRASNGDQADDSSHEPAISNDGRFVAFYSDAENLGGSETLDHADVFRRGPIR
jgi:Tol biopolymer transport system component